jgi:RNA polymerase sigma-54 factor
MSTSLAMQVAQRLEMALTPQMIQSMELLQMPLMQLEQRLRQEQLANPVLELSDLEDDEAVLLHDATDEADDDHASDSPAGESTFDDVIADDDGAAGLERVDDLDLDWDDAYDDNRPPRSSWDSDDDEQYNAITNAEARPPSLAEYLLAQLAETPMPGRIRRLAGGMVEKLDANGWLTVPLAETIPEGEEPPTPEELGHALAEVQKLEPDGVGARNLAECLFLQLANRPENDEVAVGIVERHLEDLAANRLPKIAKALKCDIEDVKRAADLIRTLNPRPGADHSAAPALAVRPELIVEEDGDDDFHVRLASGASPQVSDFFTALFDNSRRGKMLRERVERDPVRGETFRQFREQMRRSGLTRKFREKYNNAQWLVKAVQQRERTLLSVAEEIVVAQRDYLLRRTSAPAPLFMQDIADRVGYDISTVSRAVKDKYIDTPLGIKPLKDFFSRASAATPGKEATSNASVLVKIKGMIENEDKRRPLRDNEIMDLLAKDGIRLKRRSIVNYREKLGYPSHSHRKEH